MCINISTLYLFKDDVIVNTDKTMTFNVFFLFNFGA